MRFIAALLFAASLAVPGLGSGQQADRVIDGVDQSEFLFGKQQKSNRDGVVIYVGNDVHGVKWRNWKMMFKEMDSGDSPVRTLSLPHFYNLHTDPKEEHPAAPSVPENLWVRYPASKVLLEHAVSLKKGNHRFDPELRTRMPQVARERPRRRSHCGARGLSGA